MDTFLFAVEIYICVSLVATMLWFLISEFAG
jgi:hypothetical protein